mgnify:CR=1 FL=1
MREVSGCGRLGGMGEDAGQGGDEPRVWAEIGSDAAQLKEIAEAVVRGAWLVHARILDLRKLVEAVQACAGVNLAKVGEDGKPTTNKPTELVIRLCEVVEANLSGLDIGVTLNASQSRFAGNAVFNGASFAGFAWFDGASFEGDAGFDDASFKGDAGFTRASFARAAGFDRARFAGGVAGDLRGVSVRDSVFRLPRPKPEESRWTPAGMAGRLWWIAEEWARVKFGWKHVRALGQLSILARVSLVALIAVPLLAAVWPAVQAFASAYHREVAETRLQVDRLLHEVERAADAAPLTADVETRVLGATASVERAADAWGARLAELLAEDPALGTTLALTFFAAVAVTLGLLLYQIACPPEVKAHDEDDFVQRTHARYSDAGDVRRRDGLGRSIEQLEEIAERRSDRHRSFVKHGRVTVWVPPREKMEWFDDSNLPNHEKIAEAVTRKPDDTRSDVELVTPSVPERTEFVLYQERDGFMPGAERARIVIEEGAKAEYWLLCRTNGKRARLSFGLYVVGIGFLLAILVIQCVEVARAAWW